MESVMTMTSYFEYDSLKFPIFIYQETKYEEYQGKNLFLGSIRSVGLYQTSSLQPTRASFGDNPEKNQGNQK